MSKISMNTELRNKILNRYRESAESENTQELESYKQAREEVDLIYPSTFELARQVVERAYIPEDVLACRTLKKNMATLLMLLQKINAFIFLMQEKIQLKMRTKKCPNILTLVCMEI